jgi:cell wall-associated protease
MKASLIIILTFFHFSVFGQMQESDVLPKNWQLLDLEEDGIRGVSAEKAYRLLLKDKKPAKQVIVAIIDAGVDYEHADLKNVVWENKKEIPGNNIDDDKNGYPDDSRGWNFVGNTEAGTVEAVREYIRLRKDFEGKDSIVIAKKAGYAYWKKVLAEKDKFEAENHANLDFLKNTLTEYTALFDFYKQKTGKDTIDYQTLLAFPVPADADTLLQMSYQYRLDALSQPAFAGTTLNERRATFEKLAVMIGETIATADTMIARDDVTYFSAKAKITAPEVDSGKLYGNNVTMPLGDHGTACAGIVAAQRNNGEGLDGVADFVKILPVRVFIYAQEDEIDKDVAYGIRYAVDNGAQVINMSFGKYFSPQKSQVDKAIAYAETKGVLIISSAGNEANNVDSLPMYPTAKYLNGKNATNLIKVGATSAENTLVADYSNYGKKTVDLFAPGSDIFTTAIGNKYMTESGTSFSAPVVAGVAALLWSYYPTLTYKQVKSCIENSATPIETMVMKPGTNEMVPFSSLSRTGGVVNAFQALQLAQKITGK